MCYARSASMPLNSFREKPHIEALQQSNPKVTKAQSERKMTLPPSYSVVAGTNSDLPARNREVCPRDPSTAEAFDQALTGMMTTAR